MMSNEEKNMAVLEKKELLLKMRNVPELYVLMSVCTKQPYVVCDPETFDDEILMFFTEEEAREKGKALLEERDPCFDCEGGGKAEAPVFHKPLYTGGERDPHGQWQRGDASAA